LSQSFGTTMRELHPAQSASRIAETWCCTAPEFVPEAGQGRE
jgi:hypothetical protein